MQVYSTLENSITGAKLCTVEYSSEETTERKILVLTDGASLCLSLFMEDLCCDMRNWKTEDMG